MLERIAGTPVHIGAGLGPGTGPGHGTGLVPAGRRAPARVAWREALGTVEYAFQPIVQMRTGRVHGYEALLRGLDRTSFADIDALFEAARLDGGLGELESRLHRLAMQSFYRLHGWDEVKLFLNLDTRLVGLADAPVQTPPEFPGLTVVHELSERKEPPRGVDMEVVVEAYRCAGTGLALDDFGVGTSGLQRLYEVRPDYVKIDRFFIAGIHRDLRKRAIVRSLVTYAHTLGIQIVAEGIESEAEFYACRDLGCDFAQGYLLGRPALSLKELAGSNPIAEALNRNDQRRTNDFRRRLGELVERLPPLEVGALRSRVLEYFGRPDSSPIVPVVDRFGMPLGLLLERDIKSLVYSDFGRDLLRNRGSKHSLVERVVRCPICDINMPHEQLLDAFTEGTAVHGMIIIEGGQYVGFLSAAALVRLVHERNLALAADQNPLTGLPGNTAIMRHLESLLDKRSAHHVVVYFDFDNFKPFNDTFGFRQGDRAILMFSERLKKEAAQLGGFAGHIGGDDFFLAISDVAVDTALSVIRDLLDRFRDDAESLYDAPSREAGLIRAKDRTGQMRTYPLLCASAVAVVLAAAEGPEAPYRLEAVLAAITGEKPLAKSGADKLRVVRLSAL
jgi:diguanylate cyclase (GGDEF)-like protein